MNFTLQKTLTASASVLLYPGHCGLLRLEQVGYGGRDPVLQPNVHILSIVLAPNHRPLILAPQDLSFLVPHPYQLGQLTWMITLYCFENLKKTVEGEIGH